MSVGLSVVGNANICQTKKKEQTKKMNKDKNKKQTKKAVKPPLYIKLYDVMLQDLIFKVWAASAYKSFYISIILHVLYDIW